jgi:predicted Fe-Mo cluster-binding NifX family protein
MKLAVTSQGRDLDSLTYIRFDLANYFVVLDTGSGHLTAYDNSRNRGGSQNAEFQAAKMVADMGVDAVVTCAVGPQALSALQAGNVDVYVCALGSVRNAIEQFKAGRLRSATKPNVEAHLT